MPPTPIADRRRGPLRAARSLAAALALGLCAGIALGGSGLAPARAETAASASAAELTVAPVEPVLRSDAEAAEFSIRIANPADATLPAGSLRLELGPQRVESAADLRDAFPVSGELLAEVRVGETEAGGEQVVDIAVPSGDLPLSAGSRAGVYQVRATFAPDDAGEALDPDTGMDPEAAADAGATSAGDAAAATAPVVWRGAGGAQLRLSVVVPLVLPAEIRTLPTRGQLEEVVPRLDALLTAAGRHRATLAIDPRIVAGIRAYGEEAPEAAQDFLERLEGSSLDSFLLQFADADPAAQAALGFSELLAPTSLDFVTRFGSFPAVTDAPSGAGSNPDGAGSGGGGGTGSPGADTDGTGADGAGADGAGADATGEAAPETADDDEEAGEPPTLGELLAWPGDPAAWPAEGAVDRATLELLSRSGIDAFVLQSGNVTQEGGPRVALGEGRALVTDEALGSAARDALAAPNETARGLGSAELAARLALAAQDASPGLVLGLDRGAVADAEDPAALLDAIGELDWVTSVRAGEQAPGSASLRSAETLEERRELLRSAANREQSVNEVGAVLVHPEYLSGYQRTRLLDLFATRYAAADADFAAVAGEFRKRDAELLSGVHAISTEHTQLVGTSSRVPIQLYNPLPFDASVDVGVVPASAALTVSERRYPEVAVPAEGNERLLVPVRSRVSSGESGLVVTVADTSGAVTTYTGTLALSIRSSVESIALWTLGGLAALLLGLGIWRSVRRRRDGGAGRPAARLE